MIYEAGLQIFGGWNGDETGIAELRKFISKHGLTAEQIKLKRNFDCAWIETLQEIELNGPF